MAHIHEKIDFTATVFVVCNDKVLIRLHEKYHMWIGVGGHIELDEDANTAAIREVKEEVGLDVGLIPPPFWEPHTEAIPRYRELILPLFLNIHFINETHQHHDLVFAAMSQSDAVVPEYPNDQWLWLTASELGAHSEIQARTKHYGTTALQIVQAYQKLIS